MGNHHEEEYQWDQINHSGGMSSPFRSGTDENVKNKQQARVEEEEVVSETVHSQGDGQKQPFLPAISSCPTPTPKD